MTARQQGYIVLAVAALALAAYLWSWLPAQAWAAWDPERDTYVITARGWGVLIDAWPVIVLGAIGLAALLWWPLAQAAEATAHTRYRRARQAAEEARTEASKARSKADDEAKAAANKYTQAERREADADRREAEADQAIQDAQERVAKAERLAANEKRRRQNAVAASRRKARKADNRKRSATPPAQ